MAFARQAHTATGSDPENFTITFPFLLETHITVARDGVLLAQDTDYLIVSGTTVRFNSATSTNTSGDTIVITRSSGQSARLVDYATASTMTEEDFDTDSLQAFYMAQEAIDAGELSIGLDVDDQFSAENKRITDVAAPITSDDAVNKAYVDALVVASGGVPAPDDPGDDGAIIVADSGTFEWQPKDAAGNPYVVKDTGVLQDFQRPSDSTAQGIGFKNADGTRSGIIQNSSTSGGGIHISKREGSTVKAGANFGDAATLTIGGFDRLRVDSGDAQGELMVRQSTQFEGFAVGTSGSALITKGASANPEWFPVGQWLAHGDNPKATTSGTSIDFASIPSGVDEFVIGFLGVGHNGTEEVAVQLGRTAGVVTSGYLSNVSDIIGATASEVPFTTRIAVQANGASTDRMYGALHFYRFGLTWMASGVLLQRDATVSVRTVHVSGLVTLDDTLTTIRLTANGDTFDEGAAYVLYRRNPAG